MKRRGLLITLWSVCLVIILGALPIMSGFTEAEAKTPSVTPRKKVILRMAGGPPGSSKNFRHELYADVLRRANPDWHVNVIVGPTTYSETGMLGRGELNLTTMNTVNIPQIREGHYGGKPLSKPVDIVWLVPGNILTVMYYLLEKVPINSIAELKEKKYPLKVSMGRRGSFQSTANDIVLSTYGIKYKDINSWGGKVHYQSGPRSARLMADRIIEANFQPGTVPYGAIVQLSQTHKLKAIYPHEPEIQAKLRKFGFIPETVPAGRYNFLTKDAKTVGAPNVIACRADMADEVAYKITKAIWEGRKFLHSLSPLFKGSLNEEKVREWGEAFGNTLHPAARKYWKEQGLLK